MKFLSWNKLGVFTVALLFFTGCVTFSGGESSPEKLVKVVLKSLKNADVEQFTQNCVVKESFFKDQLNFPSQKEENHAYQFYTANAEKMWRSVSREALEENVVWPDFSKKELKISSIKPHFDPQVDMAFSSLVYNFSTSGQKYKLVCRDCFRIDGKWFVKDLLLIEE